MPEIQPLNNFDNTPQQNCGEGINKNVKDTNTSITVNIPPIIPQEGDGGAKSKKRSREKNKAQVDEYGREALEKNISDAVAILDPNMVE